MKKVVLSLFVLLCLFSLLNFRKKNTDQGSTSSLTSSSTSGSISIDCSIKFYEEVDENYKGVKEYDGRKFEIDKLIFVMVDFTTINYGNEDSIIDLKAQIPYSNYYSTYDYISGVKKEVPRPVNIALMDSHGNTVEGREVSGFSIRAMKGQNPQHWGYCFTIAGNKAHNDLEFAVIFSSEDKKAFSGDKKFTEKYSFVNRESNKSNK